MATRLNAADKQFDQVYKIGGFVLLILLGWLGVGTSFLFTMHGDIQAIKQSEHDRGNEIVKNIENPTNSTQLAANLSLATAQIKVAQAEGRAPDAAKVDKLQQALVKQSKEHADLPQTWQAVATLASYRTANLDKTSLPDCDVEQQPQIYQPAAIPEVPLPQGQANFFGYIFRNCTIHLDRLPPGNLAHTTIAKDSGPFKVGDPIVAGHPGYLVNCNIILNDNGVVDTGMLIVAVVHCRFEYQIDHVPTRAVQRILLASLESPSPGSFLLN